MTGQLETLSPLEPGRVRIFTCGPSIYRRPHIGNYRTFLFEDTLVRFLGFLGMKVDRVINLTDIEDKTIEESISKNLGIRELTGEMAQFFYRDAEALGILLPPNIPASSSSIAEAVHIIQILLEKGNAYDYRGDIFFDPLTYPGFGKLYKLDMSRWPAKKVRFSKDTYIGNRWNLGDFILWHKERGENIAFWNTSLGRGRPSWNIQDPAMIYQRLGDQVDINCGGIDNIYRHHDYNIAIMESFTGKEYARCYLHGEHLLVENKTMSKSRGNIIYPEDVVAKGYTARDLRFFLTTSRHYREKLNFTWQGLESSSRRLGAINARIASLLGRSSGSLHTEAWPPGKGVELAGKLERGFVAAMEDDLSLYRAVEWVESVLLSVEPGTNLEKADRTRLVATLRRIDSVLNCLDPGNIGV